MVIGGRGGCDELMSDEIMICGCLLLFAFLLRILPDLADGWMLVCGCLSG